jgi:hypothetical protein
MTTPWKSLMLVLLIGGGLLFGLFATVAALIRRDEVVTFNQEIQYDDFAFSVQRVRQTRTIGGLTAQGIYYVVTLKVANYAKRVSYEVKPTIPIVVGEDGRPHRVSFDAQEAFESAHSGDPCREPIPPGASCVKEVVFDVPEGLKDPRLRISTGGLAGDILDTIFYGRKVIRLEPEE